MRTPFEQRMFNSFRNMRMVMNDPNHDQHQRSIRDGVDLRLDFTGYKDLAKWVEENLGYPPHPDSMLVRKNQYKGFTRSNLEWGDQIAIGNRYRYCIKLKYRGKTRTLAEWARELDMSFSKIYYRYHMGLPVKEILNPENRTHAKKTI